MAEKCYWKGYTIILMICCLKNIILSSIILASKKDYCYNGIISMLEGYQILLEIKEKQCDKYILIIVFKNQFSKIKAIIILLYNVSALIFYIMKIKDITNKDCLIGSFFNIIIELGMIAELILVSMSLSNYNKTDYVSENFQKCNNVNNTFLISEEIFDEVIILLLNWL